MSSTIDTADVQEALDTFESLFGMTFEDFAALSTAEQESILYTNADVDDDAIETCFDDLYTYWSSLITVYQDMLENGTALEQAQAGLHLKELEDSPEWDFLQEWSSIWGEQNTKLDNDNQVSNGEDIHYTASNRVEGEETTLDTSVSGSTDDSWVSDPNADDPYMCDTDGDGYKDTTFYSSTRTQYNVTNIEGNIVNIDTDGDGDVDKLDGINALAEDLPVCEIDMDGATWELVDYNPDTETYRIKLVTPGDPEVVSYINVVGPCYIVPVNGVAPSEETLRSYSEDAMRHFKQSAEDTLTVGELLYGEELQDENVTYFMDGTTLANTANLTTTDEQFEAEAVITIEMESGKADTTTIDCAGADASFEWDGNDLYMTLTNADGETVTYVFKNFETAGMNGDNADLADALHLTNVDISQEEMLNLVQTSPGYGDGYVEDMGSGFYGDASGYYNYSVANCIYTSSTDDTGAATEESLFRQWQEDTYGE